MESSSTVLISIVMPTRNRGRLLEPAIESVWRQTVAQDQVEILVVDNCSTDDTAGFITRLQSRSPCCLRYHLMQEDRGPAHSRNVGASLSRGEFLAFVDSDVQLDSRWLEEALGVARADPKIAIVGGKLVWATRPDRLNSYGGNLSSIGLGWDAHEEEESARFQEMLECLWVASAAILTRRELFERAGALDDTFYIAHEDSDLGWRLNLMGYRSVCIPTAIAYHEYKQSSETIERAGKERAFHYSKNRLRSMLKNYSASGLLKYLPLYLGYSFVDIAVRSRRGAKLRALWWNVENLKDTLRRRTEIQSRRAVPDAAIDHLFSPHLFPPTTLKQRARRARSGGPRVAAG